MSALFSAPRSLIFTLAVAAGISAAPAKKAFATFAGGCFWCMESPFFRVKGVLDVIPGYSGGHVENPTYEQVSSGKTGHTESVEVTYDPRVASYSSLLEAFWRAADPTDADGQFTDRGSHYRPAVFYHNAEQKRLAEESKARLGSSGKFDKPIVVEITAYKAFYPAEADHIHYAKRNPDRYKRYFKGSGRAGFLKKHHGIEVPEAPVIPVTQDNDGVEEARMETKPAKYAKPSNEVLKNSLTPLEYKVTQQCGTERPFTGDLWDNKKPGIYVDKVSGEPLFSSKDKFESGSGWPSFTRPLEKANVLEKSDKTLGMERVEVRSKHGQSHLGHVFEDGPAPTGLRYCINSASLRFIPKEKLAQEGYGDYLALFEGK